MFMDNIPGNRLEETGLVSENIVDQAHLVMLIITEIAYFNFFLVKPSKRMTTDIARILFSILFASVRCGK